MIRELFFAYREAFRVWVRSRMTPMTFYHAEEKKLWWSKCYMFSGCGAAVTFLCYVMMNKADFKYDNPFRIIKMISSGGKIEVYEFKGFKQVQQTEIDLSTPKEAETSASEKT